MATAVLFFLSFLMFGLSMRLFYSCLNRADTERVLSRLNQGQAQRPLQKNTLRWLERAFLKAGLSLPSERVGRYLGIWILLVVLAMVIAGWLGLLVMTLLPPLLLRLYISWNYQRRVRRMIEQLPQMLDYTVRSLKSGRTLSDAVLGSINVSSDPLKGAIDRVRRNVQLGASLPDAVEDFAELYDRAELRMFALGLRVNHRYGGNASELLENLICLIREREQGARKLRAMTGETRLTAVVLGVLPLLLAGYLMAVNPAYLLGMWNDPGGQRMLLAAAALQVIGCLTLWRMLRSI